ncbi:MAG: PQQ-dependent sugar dehydrogenase [Gammaproteobacteria bacterium]|nr:PQQ-dependent sugar dehydrogenase [Gammaproteobacteria bacterium]
MNRILSSLIAFGCFLILSGCGDSSQGNSANLPVFSVLERDVLEQDLGQQDFIIGIRLDKPHNETISFNYSTQDQTAEAGTDYQSVSGYIEINAGETSTQITVPIEGDESVELDESFSLQFSHLNQVIAAEETISLFIRNDDDTLVPALVNRPVNSTCYIPDPPADNNGIELTQVFSNLDFEKPVLMLQAPGNNDRWYVVEQDGLIKTFASGDNATTLFADLTDRAVYTSGGDERGLLGMAFHPQFQSNGQVFLYYISTQNGLQTIVSRYISPDNGLTLNIPAFSNEDQVMVINQPANNHNGGHIAFDSNGYLYIGLGDGGSANDLYQNGLNTQTLLGSMLRIDVDSAPQPGDSYVIPNDNPFVTDNQVLDEIFAYGLRNPWRWSFDRLTDEIYLGDVGQGALEEIDRIEGGKHYGWGCYEGSLFNNNYAGDCTGIVNTLPLHEYPRSEGVTVVGGYVYRGSNALLTHLQGKYLFADFGFGTIWGLDPAATNPSSTTEVLASSAKQISAFAEDNNGELYVLSWSDGEIYRIDPAIASNFPILLSETGCVDPNNPQNMDSALIPYSINAPFWSDNAVKDRWFVLQDNTTITIEADGDWTFPIGSVLVKNFRLNDQLVETRLLVHHDDDSWGGYSYEWNDQQTEATLVLNGKQKTINDQVYVYPSTAQCAGCHTPAAGHVLGAEIAQFNRYQHYPANGDAIGNQIISLDNIGLFSSAPGAIETLAEMPDPFNTLVNEELRVQAYLHTNCAQCHRPGVVIQDVDMDLRYATLWGDRDLCNVAPTRGDLGVAGAQRLTPGRADDSLLYLRMNRRDDDAMPPLGSTVVDQHGARLLYRFIENLNQCPG